MKTGIKITAAVCLGFLAIGLAFVDPAKAQIRLVHEGSDRKPKEDQTYKMRLRDVQSRKLDIRSLPDPCGSSGPRTLKKQANSSEFRTLFTNSVKAPNCTFRDVVKITFQNSVGKKVRCTGILLAKKLVLTAGHCTCGKLGTYRFHRRIDRDFFAPEQENPQREQENTKREAFEFVLAAPPSRFKNFSCGLPLEQQAGRDLAILKIVSRENLAKRSPGELAEEASKIRDQTITGGIYVASLGQVYLGKDKPELLIGAGYGQTESGALPDHLRYAAVPIASFFCGQNRFADSRCEAFREFVLADRLGNNSGVPSDSCKGDSGGPIFYQAPQRLLSNEGVVNETTPNKNNIVMLVGIASRAVRGVRHIPGTLCGGGGIYTSVGHPDVIDWLRSFGVKPLSAFQYNFESADQ